MNIVNSQTNNTQHKKLLQPLSPLLAYPLSILFLIFHNLISHQIVLTVRIISSDIKHDSSDIIWYIVRSDIFSLSCFITRDSAQNKFVLNPMNLMEMHKL